MKSYPKKTPFRSRKYRKFIENNECIICTRTPSAAHHEPLGWGSMGGKAPDSHCLPLCAKHHRQRHDQGAETFWDGYDPKILVIQYLTKYLELYD